MTRETHVCAVLDGGMVKLIAASGDGQMSIKLTARDAQRLAEQIVETVDMLPREASAADLGIAP